MKLLKFVEHGVGLTAGDHTIQYALKGILLDIRRIYVIVIVTAQRVRRATVAFCLCVYESWHVVLSLC